MDKEMNDDAMCPLGASLLGGMEYAERQKERGNDLMSPQTLIPLSRPAIRKKRIRKIRRRMRRTRFGR